MADQLKHFGILGMKWGRRRGPTQKDEDRWVKKAMSRETYVQVHNRMSDRLNSTEIPRINNKPQYKNKNFYLPENKALFEKYNKEFADTVLKIANEEMNALMGPSPLGRKIVISDGGNGTTVYSLEEIKHADGNVVIVAKRDEFGRIISIELNADSSFTQEDDSSELQHFGILGMKWGRRKNRSTGPDTSSEDHRTASSLKKKKLSELSNEELTKLTKRLQLEKQYKDLTKVEMDAGRKFMSEVVTGVAKQQSINMLNLAIGNAGKLIKELIEKRNG